MKFVTLFAIGVIALSAPIAASELEVVLDPESTSVDFRLQATMHSVHGSAETVSGSLRLNTETGLTTGEIAIDATTAETGNRKRDKKMHTKVLRSVNFPRIVLRVQSIGDGLADEGASDVKLYGEMDILGVSHEIQIPLHIEILGGRFTATAEFEVPYVDWGLADPSTFVLRVAKVVEVTVKAEGAVGGASESP